MRLIVVALSGIILCQVSLVASADLAVLVDAKVLVELSPAPVAEDDDDGLEGNPLPGTPTPGGATNASYVSTGGYAVTSAEYIDIATIVFDMGATTSVARATLTMPIEARYPVGGSVPIDIFAFSDNGVIEYTDYSVGFPEAIASLELAGAAQVVLDVTGITNAMLRSGRYVGFKAKSGIAPEDIPADTFPAYKGVKFGPGYRLEFTPGAAPRPPTNISSFDGLTLYARSLNVPGFGVANVELQVNSVNLGRFTLIAAEITSGGSETGPARKGLGLLDCAAFAPPSGGDVLSAGAPSYSINSGLLAIPDLTFNGTRYAAQLRFITGTNPMQFTLTALSPVSASSSLTTVSSLGGGISIEPTQDFIPLCHGWVLVGDTSRNRLVERNVISGETAGTYRFGTKPNQLMLDEGNGFVYMSVHPESERLYKLSYATETISYVRLGESGRQYSVRDMALADNGRLFAILFDADQLDDPPIAESGLWLGLLDQFGRFVVPAIPLADPITIDYDPVHRRVFLTTESNLATFIYDPIANTIGFVAGTDVSVGSGCTDFAISPDGNRLAYPCPAGNVENDVLEPHVGIHDLDPIDYKNPDGEWYMGSAPVSTVFSKDGTLLISTDGTKLFFFDVVTHLLLQDFELGLVANEVVRKIRLSKDGNYLLILMRNALGASSGKMYWMPMPAITGTPLS